MPREDFQQFERNMAEAVHAAVDKLTREILFPPTPKAMRGSTRCKRCNGFIVCTCCP